MSPVFNIKDFEKESAHFDSLMPFKVKDILLVSSLYDIYNLHEDGQLANLVMSEYAELRLSRAPAIRRVDSGKHALEAMQHQHFDLVIVFRSMNDMNPAEFN